MTLFFYPSINRRKSSLFSVTGSILVNTTLPGREMIDALGAFMNYHDVYLFYDSYWQMKRWSFLMDHTDMVSFNAFWKKQKFEEYSPKRIEDRFKMCASFWPEDRKPLEIKNKNKNW